MPLSWNEIKSRAVAFSKEWQLEGNEADQQILDFPVPLKFPFLPSNAPVILHTAI